MKLKNAGFKSKFEFIEYIHNGGVCWYKSRKIWWSDTVDNPIRIDKEGLTSSFSYYKDFEIEEDWKDDLSEENPVICWVSYNGVKASEKKFVALITSCSEENGMFYSQDSATKLAIPVTAEDLKND